MINEDVTILHMMVLSLLFRLNLGLPLSSASIYSPNCSIILLFLSSFYLIASALIISRYRSAPFLAFSIRGKLIKYFICDSCSFSCTLPSLTLLSVLFLLYLCWALLLIWLILLLSNLLNKMCVTNESGSWWFIFIRWVWDIFV